MPVNVDDPRTIELARSIPDARGLEEIRDPFLKATVADALDVCKDAVEMRKLARCLSAYPRAADRVQKQADYLARRKPMVLDLGGVVVATGNG